MRILKQLVWIGTIRKIDYNLDCQDCVYDLHMSITSLYNSSWLVLWSQYELVMNFMPLCRERRVGEFKSWIVTDSAMNLT
jgi:hypothetical protein